MVAWFIECLTQNQDVVGWSPAWVIFIRTNCLNRYDTGLILRKKKLATEVIFIMDISMLRIDTFASYIYNYRHEV